MCVCARECVCVRKRKDQTAPPRIPINISLTDAAKDGRQHLPLSGKTSQPGTIAKTQQATRLEAGKAKMRPNNMQCALKTRHLRF